MSLESVKTHISNALDLPAVEYTDLDTDPDDDEITARHIVIDVCRAAVVKI
jgi:hypothetical protein